MHFIIRLKQPTTKRTILTHPNLPSTLLVKSYLGCPQSQDALLTGLNWRVFLLACWLLICQRIYTMTFVLSPVPRLPVKEGSGCLPAAHCSLLPPAQHHQQGQGWRAERQRRTHCVRGKILHALCSDTLFMGSTLCVHRFVRYSACLDLGRCTSFEGVNLTCRASAENSLCQE